MRKALDGVRVVDMTHVQAGPVCTQLLAWMGADVIKIEQPGRGDVTRTQLRDLPDVDSLYFTMLNGNKRSLTLNMKSDEGKQVFVKLLERADVVVENFGPGVMDRLGFPWERIHEINPRAIYASLKGFGPGALATAKAYENIAQAAGRDRRPDRRLRHRRTPVRRDLRGALPADAHGSWPARADLDARRHPQPL